MSLRQLKRREADYFKLLANCAIRLRERPPLPFSAMSRYAAYVRTYGPQDLNNHAHQSADSSQRADAVAGEAAG